MKVTIDNITDEQLEELQHDPALVDDAGDVLYARRRRAERGGSLLRGDVELLYRLVDAWNTRHATKDGV